MMNPVSDYQVPMDTAAPELKTKPCSSAVAKGFECRSDHCIVFSLDPQNAAAVCV